MSGPYSMYTVGEPDDVHGGQMQAQMGQQLPTQLAMFWQGVMQEIDEGCNVNGSIDFKGPGLPFARIKKIMRSDEDVRQMISAEAPVLFAKACELFIRELTLRSWIHTEENKRKTLQRNDTAMSISKTDTFDFLIDIVPRDDVKPPKKLEDGGARQAGGLPPEFQYYYQLVQNQQGQHHNGPTHAQHPGHHPHQQHAHPHQQHPHHQQHHHSHASQMHPHAAQMHQHSSQMHHPSQMHQQMQHQQMQHHPQMQHHQHHQADAQMGGRVDPMILYQQQAAAQQMQSLRYLQQAQMMSQLQLQHQSGDGEDNEDSYV